MPTGRLFILPTCDTKSAKVNDAVFLDHVIQVFLARRAEGHSGNRLVQIRPTRSDFTLPLDTAFEFPDFVVDAFAGIADSVGYGPGKPWKNFTTTVDSHPGASKSLMLRCFVYDNMEKEPAAHSLSLNSAA